MLMYGIGAASITGGLALVLGWLIHRLVSPSRLELVSAEWLSRFSVAKYRPMARLFSEEDYRYLAVQKGYSPKLAKRLRSERILVFRGYLAYLKSDFRRLEAALNLYMADSRTDRPDLAKEILKRRMRFTFSVLAVEFRLLLYGVGLGGASVVALVDSLDDMRVHLRRMALVKQATLA